MNCPNCGNPMTLDTASALYRCKGCGHKVAKPYESFEAAAARIRAKGARPPVTLTYRGKVDPRARSIFETGHDDLWREDKAAAMRQFVRALEVQPDFTDARLWIAKTTDDPKLKREQLDLILAQDPGHTEALRLFMVLTGRMTPEEAERSERGEGPVLKRAEQPVKVEAETLICPVCGGRLTVDETNKRVVCAFCGHTAALKVQAGGGDVLSAAMLERRAQFVRWIVGDRILRCKQCGGERTITPGRMSMICPFCGSNHVIEGDALQSIERPASLIPFSFSEDGAKDAIRQALKSPSERLVGLFEENRVARATIEGFYLPFWVFDALVEVTQTTIDNRTPNSRDHLRTFVPYQSIRIQDGLTDIAVCGVKSPPSTLTRELGEFDTSRKIPYDAKLLATYPAALYDVDFEEASLQARSIASERMRAQHGQNSSGKVEVNVFTSVIQMTFSLMLMPVWIATLLERDGDIRTVLVNGQTGQTVLGKARKA